MSNADFIEGLAATASPVARRRISVEVMALLAVGIAARLAAVGVPLTHHLTAELHRTS